MYNGNIIVTCLLNIRSLFPKVGMKLTGILHQTFPEGMIVLIQNCMKGFIPHAHSSENIERKVGEEIEFQITQIRFQKGRYDCIGQLLLQ
jgi:predicted RNA-binding protein (virulence factor B family)